MAVAQAAVVSHTGTLLSTTTVVAQAAAKEELGQQSGALAVDMESYSVGQMAAQRHIPSPSCGRSLTLRTRIYPCQWQPVQLLMALCSHSVCSAVSPAAHGSCCNCRTGGGHPRWQDAICSAGSSIFFSSEPGSMILWPNIQSITMM